MTRYVSRKPKPSPSAQILRLAEAIQEPSTLCGVLDEDGHLHHQDVLSLRLVETASFYVRVQPDVLALDYDSVNGDRDVERLLAILASLDSAGAPVVVGSGRPGHRHVFVRIGTGEDFDFAAEVATNTGFQVRTNLAIRPPMARHRQGLPVRLLEPATLGEAIGRLSRSDKHVPYTRRVSRATTTLTDLPPLPVPRQPLPEHMTTLLRSADNGTHSFVSGDGVLDRSSAIQAFLCSAACCGWNYEEVRDALHDPANALGERVREKQPEITEIWLKRSWSNAISHVTEHDRLCDAILDHAQKTLRGTRTSATDLKVITALIELCRRVHRFDVDLSQRDWLLLTGVGGAKTLRKSKGRLMPLWFTSAPGNHSSLANGYTVNTTAVHAAPSCIEADSASDVGHDIWRYGALLPNGGRVYRYLAAKGPSTSAEVVDSLRLGKPTVRKHLLRLQEWGLCKSDGGIFTALDADLDEVAHTYGAAPKGAEQYARFLLERKNFAQAQKATQSDSEIPASWLPKLKQCSAQAPRMSALANPARALTKDTSPTVEFTSNPHVTHN